MSNDEITPIRHGVLSSTGSVAAGTAGGALKSVAKTFMWCVGVGAVIGILAATGVLPIAEIAAGGAASTFWATAGKVVLGTVVGGGFGALAASFAAPVTGLFGAVKGGSQANDRVRQEKGAANAMDMQLSAYQAQAMAAQATTNVYAPSAVNDNKYNFPAQGSSMNQAMAQIQADSAQGLGTLNGRNLQIA